jgi:hypothetical protein
MKYIDNKNMVAYKNILYGDSSFLPFEVFKYNQVENIK